MIIVGAGMAGLIAANYFRKRNPTIIEKSAELPNNHAALLRFKTDKVFRVAGLPATKVTVRKYIVHGNDYMSNCNPYLANEYSQKVMGNIGDRSIWNTAAVERFIAPPDFVSLLADGCKIQFGAQFSWPENMNKPTISTIPMPVLMKQLGWKDIPSFQFRPIWVITAQINNCSVNQTIYFPQSDIPEYRASIVGDKLIIECIAEVDNILDKIVEVLDFFGIQKNIATDAKIRKQEYGKIVPIDDQLRKEFMHWATAEFGIYSLGRFATWRQILLDDVVDDLSVIERMMASNYNTMLLK